MSILTLNKIFRKPINIYGPAIPICLSRIFFSLIVFEKYAYTFRFSLFNSKSLNFLPWYIILIPILLFYLCTGSMLIGYKSKLSSFSTGIGCFILYAAFPSHHTFLLAVIVFLLSFLDSGADISIDSIGKDKPKYISYWPVTLIALLISTIYFWGAVNKLLSIDFISGDRLETIFWIFWEGDGFEMSENFKLFIVIVGYCVIVVEILLAFTLWFKKTQKGAFIIGTLMHVFMYLWVIVGPFSLMMIWCYYLFYHLICSTKFLNFDDNN